MPIRREHRWFYPVDWPQLSAIIRFERAKSRCEECRRPHGQLVQHVGDGRWWDEEHQTWRDGRGRPRRKPASDEELVVRTTRVVLATVHLDQDPTNNRGRNLRALCQRCHLLHVRPENQRRRLPTRRMRLAMGDLFLGPYRTVYAPHDPTLFDKAR